MKPIFTIILAAVIVSGTSCKKDKDPEPETKKLPQALLTELYYKNTGTGPDAAYSFTYDTKGKMTQMATRNAIIFFTYDDNERLVSDSSQGGGQIRQHYYNSKNQVERSDYYRGQSMELYRYVTYTWSNNELVQVNDRLADGSLQRILHIIYNSAGDVTRIETQSKETPDSNSRYTTFEGYIYDDKPNFMSAAYGAPAFVLLSAFSGIDYTETLSTHNLIEGTTSFYQKMGLLATKQNNYTIEYGENGYPATRALKKSAETTTFAYKPFP